MKTRPSLIDPLLQSLISALLPIFCHGSLAIGADFHISTQADFDTYRAATFFPGDNILFERGKAFTGMFAPKAVGTPGNVITISTYGSGAKPVINNNGVIHPHPVRAGKTVSAGILLFNAEYVEVHNLEVTNNNGGNQSEDLFGIYVLGEDTGKVHNHIYLEDNYVHHVNGAVAGKRRGGIHVHGYSPTTSSTATYNDVRIVNNVVDQIGGVGLGTDVDDIVDAHDFVGNHRENAITNLYVAHNWVGNTGRNSVIARDSDYAVYEYNTSANSSRHSTGNSFFNFRTLGLTFQHNEAYGNVGAPGDVDRGGFDADYNSKDTVIQHNYSHGNHWFASIMKKPNTNVTIRYNLSVNDLFGAYHYGFENATDATNIEIYNNTHYFNSSISPELVGPILERTPLETTFSNNIFYSAGSGSAGTNADNGTNVMYDTNVYFNIAPPDSEINALTADPLFVGPGPEPYDVDMEFGREVLNGYRLAANSPYIDSGITISNNGGLDFWGGTVPTGAADIGASEYAPLNAAFTVQSGDLLAGTTWDTGLAPVGAAPNPNYIHNITSGHAVTADGSQPYTGAGLSITDGSLTYIASAVPLPLVAVGAGTAVTETTTGEFFLGDSLAPARGRMELDGQLIITAEGGADAGLDMTMSGTGTATVHVEAGGTLFLTDMSEYAGVLQFNGSGDEVLYRGPPGSGMTVEMNSTGTNRYALSLADFGGSSSNVIFNQPGSMDHRSLDDRLMSPGVLTANANFTIDLTKGSPANLTTPNERRLFVAGGLRGSSNITANGTPTDPTAGSQTLNEFETGATSQDGPDATHVATDSYSGTLTLNDFLNAEVRHHLPSAGVIVNQNARLEFGHRDVESLFTTRVGEVTVNNGGILEVGYEADGNQSPYRLQLTKQRGQSGDLTLEAGATTVMQISGAGANLFDTIFAEGTVTLGGTLELWINPDVPSQTVSCGDAGADCVYTPSDGDAFEIFTIVADTLMADYDANGTVGPEDYDLWKRTFGDARDVTADGNYDGIVDATDFATWRDNLGASESVTGSIVGDFSSMVIMDPGHVLEGFEVTRVVTTGVGGNVTLTINAISGSGAATEVPEPSGFLLAGIVIALELCFRRWRFTNGEGMI